SIRSMMDDGQSARDQLFEEIREVTSVQPRLYTDRLWIAIFSLYSRRDWEEYRITASNMTPEEITLMRWLVEDRTFGMIGPRKETWRYNQEFSYNYSFYSKY
ncbi:hypothetical protein PMAYCL1PPCAC_08003, partial [Pristionchus mayeri]